MIELKEQNSDIKLRGQSKEYALIAQQIRSMSAERTIKAVIVNIWKGTEGITLGVELPHSAQSCLPPSSCDGTVKTHFQRGAKGLKSTVCWKCEQPINIDQGYLQDELGVTDLGKIPTNDPLKKLLPDPD